MKQPITLLVVLALAFLLFAAGPGLAQEDTMDEGPARDDFANRAAAAEGGARKGSGLTVPVGQKPLSMRQAWRGKTGMIFHFSLSALYAYWIEGKFGMGSNASYHEQVFHPNPGLAAEFGFKASNWITGCFRLEYMYHAGTSGIFNGVDSKFSSFSTTAFMGGLKLTVPLEDIFELDVTSFWKDVDFYGKVLLGPIHMTEVVRQHPNPDMMYWRSSGLWGANFSFGLELRLDEKFSFYVEHTFDLFSAPDPAADLRPSNKAQGLFFYVLQAGWVFYFD